jgi:copper chaperone CopZ
MAKLALLLGLALAAATPAAARDAAPLPAGRYEIAIGGMVCTVCAMAIAAEWKKLPEVQDATVDFATGKAVVTVRLTASLRVRELERGLRRASKVANLGARFRLGDIRYLP